LSFTIFHIRLISFHFISFHFISFHDMTWRDMSCHVITFSSHFISFHFISFDLIAMIFELNHWFDNDYRFISFEIGWLLFISWITLHLHSKPVELKQYFVISNDNDNDTENVQSDPIHLQNRIMRFSCHGCVE
jgi:hypothetical protein